MFAMVARRLAMMVPILLIVSVLVFGLGQLIPGDPAISLAGEQATAELVQQIRDRLGLGRPLWEQYAVWLGHAVHGDLGLSIQTSASVSAEVLSRWPNTLFLVLSSLAVTIVLGGSIGTVAAVRPNGSVDIVLTSVASFLVAVPSFVIALLLVAVFAIGLDWLPATGFRLPSEGAEDALRFVLLPAIALGAGSAGEFAFQVRAAVRSSLTAEYTLALQSRQIRDSRIIFKHGLRNAAIPLSTVLALIFTHILGAAVVIEIIFAIPGIGNLAVSGVQNSDLPVIQGVVLVFAVLTLLVNLFCDVLYGLLDPRV